MKTAVLAKYKSPPSVCVLVYLINSTNPTICPTNRSKLPYFIKALLLCVLGVDFLLFDSRCGEELFFDLRECNSPFSIVPGDEGSVIAILFLGDDGVELLMIGDW